MAMEIQLINQIEKHEFLYNFNLPEYNRKDMVEEAWANIAANTNMSVSDCKEKWRNIRSSFLRSMKPSGHKVKKPYYLTEYLKFILPFLKPISIESADDCQYDSSQNTAHDDGIIVDFIKAEPADDDNENDENHADNRILSELLTRRPASLRKRRRFLPTRKNSDSLRTKNKLTTTLNTQKSCSSPPEITTPPSNNNHAMKMFLMSLLPELETMTEDQIRLFKIKSMMLIDEIKVNYTLVRQSASTINNERLQKRLINLLLKNLEKTTKGTKNMKQSLS